MALDKKEWRRIKALPKNTEKRIWPKNSTSYSFNPYQKKLHGPIGRNSNTN